MTMTILNDCDKMVRKVLLARSCQTSQSIRDYGKRVFGEDHSVGAIGAALRKMGAKNYVAASKNENGQKVYWLTDDGIVAVEEGK